MNSFGKLNNSNIAAITQPENTEAQRFSQMRNWSGQPNRQIDQMQRQINRLVNYAAIKIRAGSIFARMDVVFAP